MVEEYNPAGRPEEIAHDFAGAWNNADADAIAALFVDDADFVNVVGLWWNTRKQIRDAHAYGFRNMFPATTMVLNKVSVRQLAADTAVVHAVWRMAGQIGPEGEPTGSRGGVISFVASRDTRGRWLAVSAQNTDTVPGMQTNIAVRETLTPASYAGRRNPKAPRNASQSS